MSPAALEPTQEHVGMYNRYGYFPAVLEWRHARKFPVTLIDNSNFTNSFSPPRLVSSEWSALVPPVAFNPALMVLPSHIAERLGQGAYYLAAVRHNNGQCENMGVNETRKKLEWGPESSLIVLDKGLRGLGAGKLPGTDTRLFSDGNKMFMTYVLVDEQTHLRSFDVQLSVDGDLCINYDSEELMFGRHQRNLGLISQQGHLFVLKWINEEMDVEPAELIGQSLTPGLHNNINPLELPEENAYLTVGHMHIEDHCSGCKSNGTHTGPKYGWKYVSYFILFDRAAPWGVQHESSPFCFPSLLNESLCESIQFVMSIVRDGQDLLVSYGINDCEAAVVRVPVDAVLSFTRSAGTFAGLWSASATPLNA